MSEIRKPYIVLVAKKSGKKRIRVELFPIRLWPDKYMTGYRLSRRYRIRINGKWSDGGKMDLKKTYTLAFVMSEFRKMLVR